MQILFWILGAFALVCFIDIVAFVVTSLHNATNFTYYICRPLFGLISGPGIGMVIGFVVRLAEFGFVVWLATYIVNHYL